jgi:hypothetical protein
MPDYITPPIETEPDDLSSEAFASLEAQVPGWLPNPGNLETWLIEALAQMAGVTADVASAVPPSIFGDDDMGPDRHRRVHDPGRDVGRDRRRW